MMTVCDIFNDGKPCSSECEWYDGCDKPEKYTEDSRKEND